MKNFNSKIMGTIFCSLMATFSFSQGNNWTINGNNNTNPTINYLGTSNNFGLSIRTNGLERIRINENTGFTSGFVGIGTNNPLFQLHVVGNQVATGQGWTRGILMSNESALMWQGAPNTNLNYFMGHSSSIPSGNFYQGYAAGIGSGAPVTYSSTVFVGSNLNKKPSLSEGFLFKNLIMRVIMFV
jgi:hypothetical protein